MNDIVIYHKNCADGFCAAWLLYRHKDIPVENMYACHYGDEFPLSDIDLEDVNTIYIVDFSFPPEILRRLCQLVEHVYVYDHHETAIQLLVGLEDIANLTMVLDTSRSGATITADALNGIQAKERMITQYVQDRDLWQWKLSDSKAISAYLGVEFDFDRWDAIAYDHPDDWIMYGVILLKQQKTIVDNLTDKPYIITWHGHKTAVVNAGVFVSEVGDALLCKHDIDIALMYFDTPERKRVFSLRSKGVKVNDIAKAYGGGGHPMAAGFRIHIGEFYI